jgi:hypothetical protein
MVRAMWFVVAAAACGGTAPPPAPPVVRAVPPVAVAAPGPALDQDLPALVARSLAMQQAVGTVLAATTDCAAVTARLGQLAGAYRDVATANAKVLHDGRGAELRAAIEPQAPAFDGAARAIMEAPTMAKCAEDPAFTRAFDALFTPPA